MRVPYTLGLLVSLLLVAPAFAQPPADRLAVERELAAEQVRYGPAHPRIRELQAQLRALPAPEAGPQVCVPLAHLRTQLEAEARALETRYGVRHPARQTNEARLRTLRSQQARLCSTRGTRGG